MITVHASKIEGAPYYLTEIKIQKTNIEIMEDLGTYPCESDGRKYDGPICAVGMISGRVLFINATSEELEARSA